MSFNDLITVVFVVSISPVAHDEIISLPIKWGLSLGRIVNSFYLSKSCQRYLDNKVQRLLRWGGVWPGSISIVSLVSPCVDSFSIVLYSFSSSLFSILFKMLNNNSSSMLIVIALDVESDNRSSDLGSIDYFSDGFCWLHITSVLVSVRITTFNEV